MKFITRLTIILWGILILVLSFTLGMMHKDKLYDDYFKSQKAINQQIIEKAKNINVQLNRNNSNEKTACRLCTAREEFIGQDKLIIVLSNDGNIWPIDPIVPKKYQNNAAPDWHIQSLSNENRYTNGSLTVNYKEGFEEIKIWMTERSIFDYDSASQHFCGQCLSKIGIQNMEGFEAFMMDCKDGAIYSIRPGIIYLNDKIVYIELLVDTQIMYQITIIPREDAG